MGPNMTISKKLWLVISLFSILSNNSCSVHQILQSTRYYQIQFLTALLHAMHHFQAVSAQLVILAPPYLSQKSYQKVNKDSLMCTVAS